MLPAPEGVNEVRLPLTVELERVLGLDVFVFMDPAPEDASEVELPLPSELERALGLDVLVFTGVVALIGVMLPELLGVVIMPALEELPLPELLPRGTKSVADTLEGELDDFPDASSMGADTVELWFFERPLRRPMLDSAFPPAYDGLLLAQLHPVKKMLRLHALIRPAKGILPIVISSPCDSVHTTPQPWRFASSTGAPASAVLALAVKSRRKVVTRTGKVKGNRWMGERPA